MSSTHSSHSHIVKRLKRAEGHLKSIVTMLENGRGCLETAQQLQAVERAIGNAKKTLVQDHIDHCLADAVREGTYDAAEVVRELRELSKYL